MNDYIEPQAEVVLFESTNGESTSLGGVVTPDIGF